MKIYKIRDLLDSIISGEWGEEPIKGQGTSVLRTTNFQNDGEISYNNVVVRTIPQKTVNQKKLLVGDIIIEKSGGSPTQPVGRVVYFDKEDETPYLCNNFTTILRPNKNLINAKFLFYLLHQNHLIGNTSKFQNKTTGIINIKLEAYLNEEIMIPGSLQLQSVYAQVLDKVKTIIKYRQKSIDSIDDFIRATFLERFGDVEKNLKNWKKVKLGSLANISTGGTPSRVNKSFFDGTIFWVKTGEVNGERIYQTAEKISELGLKNSNCVIYPPKTILVAMYGQGKTRGQVGILEVNATTNQACAAIKPSKKFNSNYLFYFLKYSYDTIRNLGRGGTQPNLNLAILRDLDVILPDMHTQNKFSDIVLKAEAIRKQLRDNLSQCQSLFQALMQKAFIGDIELSDAISITDTPNPTHEKTSIDTPDSTKISYESVNGIKLVAEKIKVEDAKTLIKNHFEGASFTAAEVINYFVNEQGWINFNYDLFSDVIFKWLDEGGLRQYLYDPEVYINRAFVSTSDDEIEDLKSIALKAGTILLELV